MDGEGPYIGESSKVRSILDLFNVSKILALVIGIVGFLLAAWAAWPIIYGIWGGIPGGIYWIVSAIINLMAYMKFDEFVGMLNERRYQALYDLLVVWIVLTLIFGVVVGILLLIAYIQLGELKNVGAYSQQSTLQPPPQ